MRRTKEVAKMTASQPKKSQIPRQPETTSPSSSASAFFLPSFPPFPFPVFPLFLFSSFSSIFIPLPLLFFPSLRSHLFIFLTFSFFLSPFLSFLFSLVSCLAETCCYMERIWNPAFSFVFTCQLGVGISLSKKEQIFSLWVDLGASQSFAIPSFLCKTSLQKGLENSNEYHTSPSHFFLRTGEVLDYGKSFQLSSKAKAL